MYYHQKKGGALKTDAYHNFNKLIDTLANDAKEFHLGRGAKLFQVDGKLNGKNGRYEWIIQDGHVTHRLFVPNGTVNRRPIIK